MADPGEAAVKAVEAGADVVLDSPNARAAAAALKAALASGRLHARASRGVGAPRAHAQGASRACIARAPSTSTP